MVLNLLFANLLETLESSRAFYLSYFYSHKLTIILHRISFDLIMDGIQELQKDLEEEKNPYEVLPEEQT